MCSQDFMITESGLPNWYPIPNNENSQLAKGMVNIDGAVYAYGHGTQCI